MNLRITAGFLKGRVLRLPDEAIGCRPTLERARISIADMIWPLITGAVCADLCAGSGAFGFEMISRGAARVDFVEKDRRYADGIRMHAAKFGVEDRCRIFGQEVFYDPPYDDPELKGMVVPLLSLLDAEGKLLYQRHRERGKRTTEAAEDVPRPVDVRLYGDTVVESYTPVPAQP
jgi:16S rRNA G966 N2-methylase RsmD